jgi:hypothetical protein
VIVPVAVVEGHRDGEVRERAPAADRIHDVLERDERVALTQKLHLAVERFEGNRQPGSMYDRGELGCSQTE